MINKQELIDVINTELEGSDIFLVEGRYPFQILLLDKPLEDAYHPLQEYPDTYVAYQPSRLSGTIIGLI